MIAVQSKDFFQHLVNKENNINHIRKRKKTGFVYFPVRICLRSVMLLWRKRKYKVFTIFKVQYLYFSVHFVTDGRELKLKNRHKAVARQVALVSICLLGVVTRYLHYLCSTSSFFYLLLFSLQLPIRINSR